MNFRTTTRLSQKKNLTENTVKKFLVKVAVTSFFIVCPTHSMEAENSNNSGNEKNFITLTENCSSQGQKIPIQKRRRINSRFDESILVSKSGSEWRTASQEILDTISKLN